MQKGNKRTGWEEGQTLPCRPRPRTDDNQTRPEIDKEINSYDENTE